MRLLIPFVLLLCVCCNDHTHPTPVIPAKATFSGLVNLVQYDRTETDSGYVNLDSTILWIPGISKLGTADSTIFLLQLYVGGYTINDPGYPKNSIGVTFVKRFHNSQLLNSNGRYKLSLNQYKDILSLGTKNFIRNYYTEDGIFIQWHDANGKLWTSSQYLNTSSGSVIPVNPNYSNASFKIDESVALEPGSFSCNQYVETSFHCTLYNIDGDSISLSNGKLKGKCAILEL